MAWTDTISGYLFPSAGGSGGAGIGGMTIAWIILAIVLIMIFLGITVAIIIFVVNRYRYNMKIVVFKRVGKNIERVINDRAMAVRFGKGDQIIYLKKAKRHMPLPTIQAARNEYWYFVREDGEWINIAIEDIDIRMRELKARFLDKEMRYSRTALQKGLADRYQKQGFWEKYGVMISYIILTLILIVGVYLWINKMIDLQTKQNFGMQATSDVMVKADSIMARLNQICNVGGVKPAV
jgi:hypothetical protein